MDGVTTVTDGVYILVKEQTDAKENGIYQYSSNSQWNRVNDYLSPNTLKGKLFSVTNGTSNGKKIPPGAPEPKHTAENTKRPINTKRIVPISIPSSVRWSINECPLPKSSGYVNAKIPAHINGIITSIEEYEIQRNSYDFIMAISALEHIDSQDSFQRKLLEMKDGVRKNGIVCLIINSNIAEACLETNNPMEAQFEVNLPTETVQTLLNEIFWDWEILKTSVVGIKNTLPFWYKIILPYPHFFVYWTIA